MFFGLFLFDALQIARCQEKGNLGIPATRFHSVERVVFFLMHLSERDLQKTDFKGIHAGPRIRKGMAVRGFCAAKRGKFPAGRLREVAVASPPPKFPIDIIFGLYRVFLLSPKYAR